MKKKSGKKKKEITNPSPPALPCPSFSHLTTSCVYNFFFKFFFLFCFFFFFFDPNGKFNSKNINNNQRRKRKTVSCQCEFRTCAVVSGAEMRTNVGDSRAFSFSFCLVNFFIIIFFF